MALISFCWEVELALPAIRPAMGQDHFAVSFKVKVVGDSPDYVNLTRPPVIVI